MKRPVNDLYARGASWRMRTLTSLLLLPFLFTTALPQENKAIVYIYRRSAKSSRVSPTVVLDGKKLAKLDEGRYFLVKLEPGDYSFTTESKTSKPIPLSVAAGKTYYLRLDTTRIVYTVKSHLILEAAEDAEREMESIRPINANDIIDRRRVLFTP